VSRTSFRAGPIQCGFVPGVFVRRAVLVIASVALAACGADPPAARGNADSGSPAVATDGPYVSKASRCTRVELADADSADSTDAGNEAPPGVLALPQVIDVGGPTLNEPVLISVTFAGDPLADELEDFVASVGCTDYWRAVTAEYGIGNAVAGTPVRLAESAPSTAADTQITSWLRQKFQDADPQFPEPVPQTVYLLFYPGSTTIQSPSGGTSCLDFGSYHSATALSDRTQLPYAVIARCPTYSATVPISDPEQALVAMITAATSHEVVEAVTDPEEPTNPAYGQTDSNHMAWFLSGLTEIADLCELQSDALFKPPGYSWYVSRAWSNQAASLGANPCMPAETSNYFYAIPVLTGSLPVSIAGGPVFTGTHCADPGGGNGDDRHSADQQLFIRSDGCSGD